MMPSVVARRGDDERDVAIRDGRFWRSGWWAHLTIGDGVECGVGFKDISPALVQM
jgi:hypothetical protein